MFALYINLKLKIRGGRDGRQEKIPTRPKIEIDGSGEAGAFLPSTRIDNASPWERNT